MAELNIPSNPMSRRQAFKVLAAITGSVAVSTLPNGWEKPELAVGAVPAKAQDGSGLAIVADSLQVSGELMAGAGNGQGNGGPYDANVTIAFDYVNAKGGVAVMDVSFDWVAAAGGEGAGYTCTDHVAVDDPTGTAGHINHKVESVHACECSGSVSIFIEDGSGQTSNTVTGDLNLCT